MLEKIRGGGILKTEMEIKQGIKMDKTNCGEWKNKSVLITGATGGVGLAAARLFYEAGANIFLTGRNLEKLTDIKEALFRKSRRVCYCSGDLTSGAGCKDIIERCVEFTDNQLDVLVNCAGVYIEGAAEDMTEEIWDNIIDTNLKGTFFMCRYAIPMLKKAKGNIINISSDAGLIGNKYAAVYCASKGGVSLLSKSLALELAEAGVRVNAICPGVIETGMIQQNFRRSRFHNRREYDENALKPYPQGQFARYIEPEEVAELIFFLASQEKAAAITGACMSIDMGVSAGY